MKMRSMVRSNFAAAFVGMTAMASALAAAAGARAACAPGDSVASALPDTLRVRTVIAGKQYAAGSLHRFLLGADYRNLWTCPIEVQELNLSTFAGGLRPVKRVGGQQTRGLALKGADGRDYTFRSLDKDPSAILPEAYRGTLVSSIVQDQIAASFPAGALAVAPLADAAGVLSVRPVLVVLPDDPALGDFRPVFAGLPGTLEEYPRAAGDGNPGFANAAEIINGEEMWKRMDASPATRPDSRAFLTARLFDILIGDWDRHRGQWRWARVPDHEGWQPIPEDRDQAFVRFEGVISFVGRQRLPQFVEFNEQYPGIEGLTWNGRDGDRRILVDLEKPEWDAAAAQLQARITDAVIADAVAQLPEGYRAREGDMLASALRHRRDQLPRVADRFYRFLAVNVDVHATDEPEVATVTRLDDGDVEVTISLARDGGEPASPYFHRTFHPDETKEVRIYLGGGADRLTTIGPRGKIKVRVIGGDGNDIIDDSAGTKLHVSDASGTNTITRGRGTTVDTRSYTPPERATAEWIPPRDWGRRSYFVPYIGGNSDVGVLFAGILQSEGYGFRKDPFADRHEIRVGYGTKAGAFGGDYRGEFHRQNSKTQTGLYLRVSALDVLHFYGFGNETATPEDENYYKVKQTAYVFEPSLTTPVGGGWNATVRVRAMYSKTNLDEDRFIATVQPYGSSDFFQAGLGAGLAIDTRGSDIVSSRGVRLDVSSTVFPPLAQVEETFGEVRGEAACYQPIPVGSHPVLALRAGGKQVWGPYPYYEAAAVGGANSVRGFATQRFLGDASLYGNAELRIPLARMRIFVPGTVGVFALGDVGRVFLDGESSQKWHSALGGGAWFALAYPANAVSLAVAASDEDTRVYVRAGLSF